MLPKPDVGRMADLTHRPLALASKEAIPGTISGGDWGLASSRTPIDVRRLSPEVASPTTAVSRPSDVVGHPLCPRMHGMQSSRRDIVILVSDITS